MTCVSQWSPVRLEIQDLLYKENMLHQSTFSLRSAFHYVNSIMKCLNTVELNSHQVGFLEIVFSRGYNPQIQTLLIRLSINVTSDVIKLLFNFLKRQRGCFPCHSENSYQTCNIEGQGFSLESGSWNCRASLLHNNLSLETCSAAVLTFSHAPARG